MPNSRKQELRDLIDRESDGPVLSVFCRTDPREPTNMSDSPGWQIALRNGLRAVVSAGEGDDETHEAARRLSAEAERRLTAVSPAERGRSVALFLSAGGEVDRFETFQIPVREDMVTLDAGPVVWPMVDVIDRGQRTALIVLSSGRIRLLDWSDGRAVDVEGGSWDLELGDWREYRGAARANPARGQQSVVNTDAYQDRVGEWQARFVKESAKRIAEAVGNSGVERLIVAAEGDLGQQFVDAIPEQLQSRVAAVVPANLIDKTAAEVADHLDPHLREAWRSEVHRLAAEALNRVKAGDRAASGVDEVLLALAEGRVEHLVFDPYMEAADESTLSEGARQAIEIAGESTAREALVEVAIRTDARITSASVEEAPALAEAGGVLATLRY